jgi:hypothetical protein
MSTTPPEVASETDGLTAQIDELTAATAADPEGGS